MNANRGRSTGQALTECLVVCLALVPLWFAVQRIARWQDLQSAMVQQARQVAFAAALSPARPDAIAAVDEFALPLQGDAPVDPYHRDPRSGLAVSGARGGVRHTLERRSPPGVAGIAQTSALALIQPIDALSPGRPDWMFDSWLGASVEVDVALSVDLPNTSLVRRRWNESLRLLVDDGSLPGPREVAVRTDALLPLTPLDLAHAAIQPVRSALALLEPSVRDLCARRIDPEQVPRDRLLAAYPSANGQLVRPWRPTC
jgi:hypothetical protein